LPTGTSTIELHDSKSGNFAYLFVVNNPDDPPAPLLMTDQGFLVKKDLAVGGFVNSIQGALWLNYGLVGRPILSSPPCIEAMSSGTQYPSGASLPPDPEKGQLFNHSGTKKMWNGSSWITRNFSGYYDTIFLFKSDGISPAHLDLGNLTAQGAINFYDDNVRLYRDTNSLRVQTPGGAGLIVEQNLWCNALAVNTDAGITGMISSSNGALLNAIAIGNAYYGSLTWPYESMQLASNYNLRIYFGTTEKYVFGNNGTFTVNNGNILPASQNVGNIGTNTLYWGSIWGNYVRYKNLSSFDALDDLVLAKNYKIKTITEDGVQKEVVDHDSMPFLKAEGEEPFFDLGKTNGFLLGCIKALVLRVEKLEAEVKGMAA
jgi:hypothetical protein